jgi:hypothetical protein
MKCKPKPIHRSGNRNIHCPHYDVCLDHCAKRMWRSWDCSRCYYKSIEAPLEVFQVRHDSTVPYYIVSPEIGSKTF